MSPRSLMSLSLAWSSAVDPIRYTRWSASCNRRRVHLIVSKVTLIGYPRKLKQPSRKLQLFSLPWNPVSQLWSNNLLLRPPQPRPQKKDPISNSADLYKVLLCFRDFTAFCRILRNRQLLTQFMIRLVTEHHAPGRLAKIPDQM